MKNTTTSNRLMDVPASPIRKLVPYALQAKQEGVKVYHLNIGDPDIETPSVMLEVLRSWDQNPIRYAQSQGEIEFIDALKLYYHRLGHKFLENKNIQVTSGGSEAISMAMFAVANPGDEILVFEPFYANYLTYAAVNGITLVAIPTTIENGFHLSSEFEIEQHITDKTKAILYCNPNNPTGTVYTKEEVDMLVRIAKKHNLYLLSDEVYREYIYDGLSFQSILSYMEEYPERSILLDSVSKRYSLCGLRLGAFVSLNSDIMDGVLRIAQGRLSAGLIDQAVAAKLTDVPESYMSDVHKEYKNRRDVLLSGLRKIPGIVAPNPEGAFYAIVGLPVDSAEHFCQWLLTDFRDSNETVMLAPAAGFYATQGMGKNEVRIAYVLNASALKRCITILQKALQKYKHKHNYYDKKEINQQETYPL